MTRPVVLDRRAFLRVLGSWMAAAYGLGGSLGLLGSGCGRRPASRPNILFILTDDHAHGALGCADHPWIRTPNLDRLCERGVRFSNAFVTSSLCSPSRASFLSGLYPHEHGVGSNEVNDLPLATPTFPRLLQAAGYRTGFIGKWHMARWASPRPGFDHWVSWNGQGDYFRNTLNVDGTWELCRNYITDEITDRGIGFLERDDPAPFMLMLSHKAVHQPFRPAPRHARLYEDVHVLQEVSAGDRLDLKPDWGGRMPEPDRAAFMREYARTLAAVDEGVGRILDALEDSGRLKDTVIVYAGDNGFMSGEHGGLWDKRAAYEGSIRIPLIVSHPGRFGPGSVSPALALNIDVMPTLLQAAGLSPPPGLPGMDLAGLADGSLQRDAFLYEYFQELGPVPTTVAVRTDRYKYITYPRNPDLPRELYDLRYDPDELVNRAAEADYGTIVEDLAARLEELKIRTGFHLVEPEVR